MIRKGLATRLALQYAVKVLHEDCDLQSYLDGEGLTEAERKEAERQLRQIVRCLRDRLAPEHRDV
jgi:hypothetical protein